MNLENTELKWLDEHHEVSFDDLAELSGLSMDDVLQLVECGALVPNKAEVAISESVFSSHNIISIRKLSRIKQDFELPPNSLGLILVFLERIRILELELSVLKYEH